MNLKKTITDALDGAYLLLARIGEKDMRNIHATISLTGWLALYFGYIFFFINHWIYPVYDVYLELWPYREINYRSPFSTTFALSTFFAMISGWIAYRTSKRCKASIDYEETTRKEWICFFIWMIGIGVFSGVLVKNKYTCAIPVVAHALAFFWASRHARHSSEKQNENASAPCPRRFGEHPSVDDDDSE